MKLIRSAACTLLCLASLPSFALSEQGQAIWRDIDQCGNRVRERAMRGMDEAQRLQFIRVLEQVRDNLSFPGQ